MKYSLLIGIPFCGALAAQQAERNYQQAMELRYKTSGSDGSNWFVYKNTGDCTYLFFEEGRKESRP